MTGLWSYPAVIGLAVAIGLMRLDAAQAQDVTLPATVEPSQEAEAEAPQIVTETAEEAAPAEDAAPQAQAPMIPLPRAPAEPSAAEDLESATPVPSTPEPVSRDAGAVIADLAQENPLQSGGWTIRPRPASNLPEGYAVGASLPEPGILRITGEMAATKLSLDLPQGAASFGKLQLSLHSSVNLAPEQSFMQVQINEAEPVVIALDRLGDFGLVEIPSTGLIGGHNVISLTLTQPHRIFCGPEATFGVWTEISLSQSGLRLENTMTPVDPQSFALAVLSQTSGGRNLTLLASPEEDPEILRAVTDELRRALGRGGRVEQRSFYELGPPPMASVALIAADMPLATIRRGAGGGLVLQIQHKDGALPDLSAMLDDLKTRVGQSDQGLAIALPPDEIVTLADLGSDTITGNTRYFRHEVPFSLPNDWLLMANQKARLDLLYGFSRGLPEGAMLLIKANGTTIRLLPLHEDGGDVMPKLPVTFDANLLHPGRNILSFEMIVPGAPANEVCPVQRADLLAILGDSTLFVPPSPAMILPGLVPVLQRLDPAGVIPTPGVNNEAELNIIAQEIAGELDPMANTVASASISVARVSDLSLVPLDILGISQGLLEEVLFPPSYFAPVTDLSPAPQTAQPRFQLSEEDQADPSQEGSTRAPFWGIWHEVSLTGWVQQKLKALRDSAFLGSTLSLQEWLEGREGDAILLRPDPEQRIKLWLVLGPNANPRAVGIALKHLSENGLAQGEVALLTAKSEWQVWSPIRPPYLLEQPKPQEWRTALGNYASWSPLIFTLVMLVSALLSALPALLYLILSRREDRPS